MTISLAQPAPPPEPAADEPEDALADIRLATVASASVAELAREHGLALTRFAYLICGDRDRAQDLVQDALLAMHRRFGPDLPISNPLAYARRAVINGNISWSRRPLRREVPSAELPERAIETAAPDDRLWQLLQALDRRPRAVLVLRYYLGYPDAEIADLLDCRRATVRSIAARALAELRDRLNNSSEDFS